MQEILEMDPNLFTAFIVKHERFPGCVGGRNGIMCFDISNSLIFNNNNNNKSKMKNYDDLALMLVGYSVQDQNQLGHCPFKFEPRAICHEIRSITKIYLKIEKLFIEN